MDSFQHSEWEEEVGTGIQDDDNGVCIHYVSDSLWVGGHCRKIGDPHAVLNLERKLWASAMLQRSLMWRE